MVDSTDIQRMEEARVELFDILDNEPMRGVPIVVLANKQDVVGKIGPNECMIHIANAFDNSFAFTGRKDTNF